MLHVFSFYTHITIISFGKKPTVLTNPAFGFVALREGDIGTCLFISVISHLEFCPHFLFYINNYLQILNLW